MNEHWVAAAITSDALVAELLLCLKQSSLPTTTASLSPRGWGDRKSRSKPSTVGCGKGQQQRSPSTPLSWSGGAGPSTSDGYEESSRRSDLLAGDRSIKVEGSTTSIHDKSRKRKIDLHHIPMKEDSRLVEISCNIESKIARFELPDLNETPTYES